MYFYKMLNNQEVIGYVVAVLVGSFAIIASILNWELVFNNVKSRLFVKILGRNGARIVYFIFGLIFYYLAYQMYQIA
jgi:small neutral amino acid transporter SnatA (MarC family)